MIFASSLDPDQDWQNVVPILSGLIWIQTIWQADDFPEEILEKLHLEKYNVPACKE